jgi:hypothetical protein
MRPIRPVIRQLVLAVTCLLTGATVAEASPRRGAPPAVFYPPLPSYYSGGRVGSGVYVYPQVTTTPRYYPVYPYYPAYPYGSPYYGGSYSYGSWGGTSYYPAYPYYGGSYSNYGFYFRFRIR